MKPRTSEDDRPEGLDWWVGRDRRRTVIRARLAETIEPTGVRFAFYGRISTGDFQDRVSSGAWQRNFAADLVAGHGEIVIDFFDVCSRRLAWSARPEAARFWRRWPIRIGGSTRSWWANSSARSAAGNYLT